MSISDGFAMVTSTEDDDNGSSSGATYVFKYNGANWVETQKLTPADGAANDDFGTSVSISGSFAVITAFRNTNANGSQAGAAYIYQLDGNTWTEYEKLISSDGTGGDGFGFHTDISGEFAFISAHDASSNGACYVFEFDGINWLETQKLVSPSVSNELYSARVSISDEIGAVSAAAGNSGTGSAYIYRYNGTSWIQEQELVASDGAVSDRFGFIDVSGNWAVVGAYSDDDGLGNSGSAYLFKYNGSTWVEEQKINASSPISNIAFGQSVAISGNEIIVGAPNTTASTCRVYFFEPSPGNICFPIGVNACDSTQIDGTWYTETQLLTDTFNISSCQDSIVFYDVTIVDCEVEQYCELEKVLASDGTASDGLGSFLDISGNLALITALDADAVYVFRYNGSNWIEEQILTTTGLGSGDNFGVNVSIQDNWAVIGNNSDDDIASNAGAVHIFYYDGSIWTETQKLFASDAAADDLFGTGVAISAGKILIGARDAGAGTDGAAYIFEYSGSSWVEQQKLLAFGGTADRFGGSVELWGDVAVVGAYGSDAAFTYRYNGSTWVDETKLVASDGGALFGTPVAVSGDWVVVGDVSQNSSAGAVYAYEYNGSSWIEAQKIEPSDLSAADVFGRGLDISGNTFIAGTWRDDGVQSESGSAYIYEYNGSSWVELQKLYASDEGASDRFGIDVGISGNNIVVGASQDDDNGSDAGAIYFFHPSDTNIVVAQNIEACDSALIGSQWYYADTTVYDTVVDVGVNCADSIYVVNLTILFDVINPQAIDACDSSQINGTWYSQTQVVRDTITTAFCYDSIEITDVTITEDCDASGYCETQIMTPSDGPSTSYGEALAIFGNRAVVTDRYNDTGATDAGVAYVLEYNGTNWVETAILGPSVPEAQNYFGVSADISEDRIIIGALWEDDAPGQDEGGAYIFDYDGSSWNETTILRANVTNNLDLFGISVALSGDVAIVGARYDDDLGSNSGSAHIYEFDGNMWSAAPTILAPDGVAGNEFGESVDISGSFAIVGAPKHGHTGNPGGAAYIYERTNGSWNALTEIRPTDLASVDYFGQSVAISDSRAIIGSMYDDDNGSASGSAYIYFYDGSSWNAGQKLTASDGAASDEFGRKVDISGDYALVGAERNAEYGSYAGAAYLFKWNGSSWDEIDKLVSSDIAPSDQFGGAVSISGNNIVIAGGGAAYFFEPSDTNIVVAGDFTVCDSAFVRGNWYNTTQIVYDTVVDVAGNCADSIYIIDLTINNSIFVYDTLVACDSGLVNGTYYYSSQDIVDSLTSSGNCDSIVWTSLTIEGDVCFAQEVNTCDSAIINGTWYFETQVIEDVFALPGCGDSIVTTILIVSKCDETEFCEFDKIVASDRQALDNFGIGVGISGDWAVVGASAEDHDENGLNLLGSAGSAYIFNKQGGNWVQTQKIVASDRAASDFFGRDVAISGNYILVGSWSNDLDENGNNPLSAAGAVYIFKNNSGTWTQIQKLVAPVRDAGATFGSAVSISGNQLVIGTSSEEEDADEANTLFKAGAAYVYKLSDGVWEFEQKIDASDRSTDDQFGISVSISGEKVAIGANLEDHDASGNNFSSLAGSVYLFNKINGTWIETQKIVASDRSTGDRFGTYVSLSEDQLLVTAAFDQDDASNSNPLSNAGSAYFFEYNGSSWSQLQKVDAPDRESSDQFGWSGSVSGDQAVIGAFNEDEDADEMNSASNAGSAYVFRKNAGTWNFLEKIVASDRESSDFFGHRVGISGDHIIVGALLEDEDANGNNSLSSAGSAYIFEISDTGILVNVSLEACDSVLLSGTWYDSSQTVYDTIADAGANCADSIYIIDLTILDDIIIPQAIDTCDSTQINGIWYSETQIIRDTFNTATCQDSVVITDLTISDCTVDDFCEMQKVFSGDIAASDIFGEAVAIYGDWAVISAPEDDDNGSASGSVYVFQRSGSTWTQFQKLTASDAAATNEFGSFLAINGNWIAVGTYSEGKVYMFEFNGTTWVEQQILTAFSPAIISLFGNGISISGNYMVIGDQTNAESAPGSGLAFTFLNVNGVWENGQILDPSDGVGNDNFGRDVSISGDVIVVGSRSNDGDGANSGSAYFFRYANGLWIEEQKVTASDAAAGDEFGEKVNATEDRVIIGASGVSSFTGAAYVFDYNGTSWSETVKLTASDATASDVFGRVVSISGDRLIVGARGNDDAGNSSGSAYLFNYNGSSWIETKLVASDATINAEFGSSVSISAETILIGAWMDDDVASNAGSAYFFGPSDPDIIINDTIIACDSAFVQGQYYASSQVVYDTVVDAGTNCADSVYIIDLTINNSYELYDTIASCDSVLVNGTYYNSSQIVFDTLVSVTSCDSIIVTTVNILQDIYTPLAIDACDSSQINGTWYFETQVVHDTFSLAGCNDSIVITELTVANCDAELLCETEKVIASDGLIDDWFGRDVYISGNVAITSALGDDDNGSLSGSVYILRYNGSNWIEEQKLTASDGAAGDSYGWSVAISGDWAVIGSRFDDDAGSSSGSAYVFYFNGSTWIQFQKLTASDAFAGDVFGYSVAISGNTILVMAPLDDDNVTSSGSGYFYEFDGSFWVEKQKIYASDPATSDFFGYDADLSGVVAVVGAYGNDDNGTFSGSAYIYRYDGNNWIEDQKLLPSDGAANDWFGLHVGASVDKVIVSAHQNDDNGSNSGSAYIWMYNGSTWVQEPKLLPSTPAVNQNFGYDVSISGDIAVIGGYRDMSSEGTAFVFEYNGSSWSESQRLDASDGALGDVFGYALNVSGNNVIVGAYNDDDNGNASGSVYFFQPSDANIIFMDTLVACDSALVRGQYYATSQVVYDTVVDAGANCADSIYIIDVTINNSYSIYDSLVACDSALINGNYYASTQIVYDTFSTVESCDSIFITDLIINNLYELFDTITSCDSVLVNGTYYSASQTVIDSFISATNCDSIIYTYATINNSYAIFDTVVACDSALVNGNYYLTTQTVYDTFATSGLCDSVVITDVLVNYPSLDTIVVDTCLAGGYIFGFDTLSVSGFYTDTFGLNSQGCDSVLVLDLTIGTSTIIYVDVDASGANNGTMWTDAYNDLTDALTFAAGCPVVEEIWVAEGTYYPSEYPRNCNDCSTANNNAFHLVDDVKLFGGFNATETSLEQRDYNTNTTILSGDLDMSVSHTNSDAYHILMSFTAAVYVDGFTIEWAHANLTANTSMGSFSIYNARGGGAYFTNSNAMVVNCIFADNDADYGGAIYGIGSNHSFYNSLFYNNTSFQGGIIYNRSSDGEIVNCTFADNGIVFYTGTSTSDVLNVTNCIVWNNSQQSYAFGGAQNITYTNSLLQDSLRYIDGGGNIFGADPLFVDDTNADYQLLGCSPAIDAGDDSSIPIDSCDLDGDADTIEVLPYDLNYDPRQYLSGTVDMGAYEFQGGQDYLVFNVTDSLCANDSIFLEGMWQTMSGTYTDTINGSIYCDTVRITELTVLNVYENYDTISSCDSVLINGTYYDSSQIVYDTLLSVSNCDSIVITTLNILKTIYTPLALDACDSAMVNGTWYYETQTIYDTISNTSCHDSIVITDLTIEACGIYDYCEIIKVLASDGAADDEFGLHVDISGNWAIVGASSDDDNGSNSGSAYIFQYNGTTWIQAAKLTAGDGAANDNFGSSVGISGNTAIVGANGDDGSRGSAYIFSYNGSTWLQSQKLTASDGSVNDIFGFSVSISDNNAVVGAWRDTDNGSNSGSAYMYTFNGSDWIQSAKLLASDGHSEQHFGISVSISGNSAIIGANGDNQNAIGSGAAYIYSYNGTSWLESQKLIASDGAITDRFGASVSISDDILIIGANEDASGSAYIFSYNGTVWSESTKLTASDGAAGDFFGYSASISGNTALVGAYIDDPFGPGSGSAYVYSYNGSSWNETQKLIPSDGAAPDLFGVGVAISDNSMIVGANYNDDNGSNSGSAYFFEPSDTVDIVDSTLVATCDSAFILGQWYAFSQIITDTVIDAGANCADSIYIIDLTINNSNAIYDTLVACDSALINGNYYASTQIVYDTFSTVTSCDSVFITDLIINNLYESFDTITSCDSVQVNGTYYLTTQQVIDSFTSVTNCDSIIYTDLTINNSYSVYDTLIACDSALINGNYYSVTQVVYDTFSTTASCDSVFITDLTINNLFEVYDTIVACDSALVNGIFYSTTQQVVDSFTSVTNCDSIIYTDLTINNSYSVYDTLIACDSALINGNYYSSTQIVYDSFSTVSSCDSVFITNLTINNLFEVYDTIVACDSALVNGIFYSTTQQVVDSFTSVTNCDSIIYTDLTINNSYSVYDTLIACDSALINGNYYSSTQIVYDSFTIVSSCDSVIITDLTINNLFVVYDTITSCDSVQVNGTFYDSSQTVYDTLLSVTNCDSVVITTLNILQDIYTSLALDACDSSQVNGNWYNSTQVIYDTFNISGCQDSIVITDLTISDCEVDDYCELAKVLANDGAVADQFGFFGRCFRKLGSDWCTK